MRNCCSVAGTGTTPSPKLSEENIVETTKDNTPYSDPTTGSASTSSSGESAAVEDKVKRDAEEAKHAMKDEASKMADQAKSAAKDKAAEGANRAADEADKISSAVEAAAQEDEDREGMASYVRELGEGMSTFAERLQNRNVEQLTEDARTLARDNPTAFLLGSVAVGFGLSRFFKASAERDHSDASGASHTSTNTMSSTTGNEASSLYTGSTPAGGGSTVPNSGTASATESTPSTGHSATDLSSASATSTDGASTAGVTTPGGASTATQSSSSASAGNKSSSTTKLGETV